MAPLNPGHSDLQRALRDALAAHWRLFLFQGALMIILGVLAVAAPAAATIAADIYIGWLFLVSGIVGLVAMFSARDIPAFLWSLVTAVLSLAVGGVLFLGALRGAPLPTGSFVGFFISAGVFPVLLSLSYPYPFGATCGWAAGWRRS